MGPQGSGKKNTGTAFIGDVPTIPSRGTHGGDGHGPGRVPCQGEKPAWPAGESIKLSNYRVVEFSFLGVRTPSRPNYKITKPSQGEDLYEADGKENYQIIKLSNYQIIKFVELPTRKKGMQFNGGRSARSGGIRWGIGAGERKSSGTAFIWNVTMLFAVGGHGGDGQGPVFFLVQGD